MILRLDSERLRALEEVREFLAGSEPVDFTNRRGACDFGIRALARLDYGALSEANKGVVRRFVAEVTGLATGADDAPDSVIAGRAGVLRTSPRSDARVRSALHLGRHPVARGGR